MSGPVAAPVGLLIRLLRAEGPRALVERWRDRRLDERRARAFVAAEAGRAPAPGAATLWVLPFPLQRRRGGAAIQLLVRLEERSAVEPVALLQRLPGSWRCELWGAGVGRRLFREWPVLASASPELAAPASEPPPILLAAARWAGAVRLHFESLAGLPLAWPLALQEQGFAFGCSAHDFALFCPRPHLVEEPSGEFCGFSTDMARCARCLAADRVLPADFQAERRKLAARLLAAAESVEFPSEYMRREHLRLFPGLDAARTRIVLPRSLAVESAPAAAVGAARAVARPPLRIAYAGAVHRHKGALEFEEVVRRLAASRPNAYEWHVFGGGDPALLRRLRQLPRVRVHGYYGAGTLPYRLQEAKIDLVLLLSIWPEAHCLVLDEVAAAGVPVVAFDLGALGERVADEGLGAVVEAGPGSGKSRSSGGSGGSGGAAGVAALIASLG